MPSYLGKEIVIGLIVSNLDKTITESSRTNTSATKSCRQTASTFITDTSSRLKELLVPLDGTSLRFIGEHQDVPFFLAKTSKDISANSENRVWCRKLPAQLHGFNSDSQAQEDQDGAEPPLHLAASTRKPRGDSTEIEPEALSVSIRLGSKAFLSRPRYAAATQEAPVALDVKIDIYFNGELCVSSFVSARYRNGTKPSELTQRFSGRRIDRLLERPWVFVPPGQNPDGTLKHFKFAIGSQQRLRVINRLLSSEAEKLGRDVNGQLTQLGKYLVSLSKIEIPELQSSAKTNVKYGIIDVVLTSGQGKKDDPSAGYLSQPISMRLSELQLQTLANDAQVNDVQTNPRARSKATPINEVEQPTITVTKTMLPGVLTSQRIKIFPMQESQSDLSPTLRLRQHALRKAADSLTTPSMPTRSIQSTIWKRPIPPDLESQRKRNHGDSTMSTCCKDLENPSSTTRRSQRLSRAEGPEGQAINLSTIPQTLATGNDVIGASTNQLDMFPVSRSPGTISFSQSRLDPPMMKLVAQEDTTIQGHIAQNCIREPSSMSDDCVATYAPDVVRQTRAERTGWFKESSVLLGVRYLVL